MGQKYSKMKRIERHVVLIKDENRNAL